MVDVSSEFFPSTLLLVILGICLLSSVHAAASWCLINDTLGEAPCFPRCPPDQPQTFATSSTLTGLQQVLYEQDCALYNYVTESRIYPEDLSMAVVTKRGWVVDPNNSTGAGVTLLDMSDPTMTHVLDVWASPNGDTVEGQDRFRDLLVVSSIDQGGLYVFRIATNRTLQLLSYTDIPWAGSTLHVKLKHYPPSDGSNTSFGRLVAFASQGWCDNVQQMQCDKYGWTKIHIVDISNATHPTVLNSISTGVTQPEGIYLVNQQHLYVGGIGSPVLSVVDIADPENPRIVSKCVSGICQTKPYYSQMVGEIVHDSVDGSYGPSSSEQSYRYWAAALFSTPGGMAIFDTQPSSTSSSGSNPPLPLEVSALTDKVLSTANRMHIHNGYALIPMEQDPAGGFAVVNVANPACPQLVGVHFLGVGSTPSDGTPTSTRVYCLVVTDDVVNLFCSKTCERYAFRVPFLAQPAPLLECTGSGESTTTTTTAATSSVTSGTRDLSGRRKLWSGYNGY